MSIKEIISNQKDKVLGLIDRHEIGLGEEIFSNGLCQMLSQSAVCFELIVLDEIRRASVEYKLNIELNGNVYPGNEGAPEGWNRYSYACLLQVENELQLTDPQEHILHKKYTREGMINRVLKERQLKAEKANYHIEWADNIYGEHILTNENGIKYKIFLHDFEKETGYSNSMDSRLNKLGTTKHIMYAYRRLKDDKNLFDKLDKTCPFIEIFCDPNNDYRISWFYHHLLPENEQSFISSYFKNSSYIADSNITKLLGFIVKAREFPNICIRPEVVSKVESAFEKKMLSDISNISKANFNSIKADLYPYQKEGIQFALFRKVAIIADAMGLGKTI